MTTAILRSASGLLAHARALTSSMLSSRSHLIAVSQVVTGLGFFLQGKLVSNFLSVGDFGRFALFLIVGAIVNMAVFGPTTSWALRHLQEAQEGHLLRAYYAALTTWTGAATAVATAAIVAVGVGAPQIYHGLGLAFGLVLLGLVLGVTSGINDLTFSIFLAAMRRRAAAFALISSAWFRIGGICLARLIGVHGAGAYATALAGSLLALSCIEIYLLLHTRRDWEAPYGFRSISPFMRPLVRYAIPLLLGTPPLLAVLYGDRIVLAHFKSSEVVGTYAAMTTATTSMALAIGAAISFVVLPAAFAAAGAGTDKGRVLRGRRIVHGSAVGTMFAGLLLVIPYVFWPRRILSLFTSGDYGSHAGTLWLLALAGVLTVTWHLLLVHGYITKQPGLYVAPQYVYAAFLIGGLVLVVPRFGIAGATSMVLAATVLQVLMVIGMNRFRGRSTADARTTASVGSPFEQSPAAESETSARPQLVMDDPTQGLG